jgi:hypothetical protein
MEIFGCVKPVVILGSIAIAFVILHCTIEDFVRNPTFIIQV